jgi:hypothetical protein
MESVQNKDAFLDISIKKISHFKILYNNNNIILP